MILEVHARKDDHHGPNTWKRTQFQDGSMIVYYTCPRCGMTALLGGHEIRDDGTVVPSVICPFECGFHGQLILEEWPGG